MVDLPTGQYIIYCRPWGEQGHIIAQFVPQPVWQTIPTEAPAVAEEHLTGRERSVLQRLAQGESNKVIAKALGVTEGTVKVHLKGILRKLKLANRTQAALYAAQYTQGLR